MREPANALKPEGVGTPGRCPPPTQSVIWANHSVFLRERYGLRPQCIMTEQEQQFIEEAKAWVKANRTELSRSITDTARHPREDAPVSVFMAGSPGAGKTETSKAYIEQFNEDGIEILRIDPDEYRELIPGYTGDNSWMVQPAVSLLVERVLDRALSQRQSFILDGTFANLSKSRDNIRRSLEKGRFVQILYVYQEPPLAWGFVLAREAVEGRKIPFDRFAEQFVQAQACVQAALEEFGDRIRVEVLVKPIDNGRPVHHADVKNLRMVLPSGYTTQEIYSLCQQEKP